MHVLVVYDWRDTEQNKKGLWLESYLRSTGYTPREWNRVGGNWIAELDEATAKFRDPCFLVFTPGADAATPVAASWHAILAAGDDRLVIPVCFGGARVPSLLGSRVHVEIASDEGSVDASAILSAALAKAGLQAPIRADTTTGGLDPLAIDPTGDLPRLRRLTDLALRDAGTVGERVFTWAVNSTGPRLYVSRDVQDEVVARLREQRLVVVSGAAGAGKTSLLWGVAQELLSGNNNQVFFLRASMLTERAGRPPLMTVDRIRNAVRESRKLGAPIFLLIDTGDVLVSDDEGYLTLMDVIDIIAAGGGSTLVASRPIEAKRISGGAIERLTLGSYAMTPETPGLLSEFERAVASHAMAYCRMPGDTSELAEQISSAAVREQPLGVLAQRPLTLRMLFELYAPAMVPSTIDATELMERFWHDRVFRDRRIWATSAEESRDSDLTGTAMRIAHQMIRTGVPEVVVADIPTRTPADRGLLDAEVEQLCSRGVGQRGEFGTFAFFHQTFFEFAAAKDLLAREVSPMPILAKRVRESPDDAVLLAILEQTWICAYRSPDPHRSAASGLTTEVLAANDDDRPNSPFGLRRCAIVVGAQSALDTVTRTVLGDALGREPDPVVVRDYLALLPRPGRPWTDADTALLLRCWARGDSSWHSAVDVLRRVAAAEPDHALAAAETTARRALPVSLTSADALLHKQTRDLLAMLLHGHTGPVLRLLRRAVDTDPTGMRRVAVLEKVYGMLDAESDSPAEIVDWVRTVTPSQRATSVLVGKAARLYRRAVLAVLDTSPGADVADDLLERFEADLDIIEASQGHPPVHAAAACWGLVSALGSASVADDYAALTDRALETLLRYESPRVHEQIHHGWLVDLVNTSAATRRWVADRLIAGLPASHSIPTGGTRRWADSMRRTLERADIERAALAVIVESVVDTPSEQWDVSRVWTDPDLLLRLLLPSACADLRGARETLAAIVADSLPTTAAQNRILAQQAQRLRPADAADEMVVEMLVRRTEYEELKQLCTTAPPPTWNSHTAAVAVSSALTDTLSHKQKVRRSAAKFLACATEAGIAPFPPWDAIARCLSTSTDAVVRADLAQIGHHAVNNGVFAPGPLIGYLRTRLAPALDTGSVGEDHEIRVMRRLQVSLLAMHGTASDRAEMIDLAFLPDTETSAIAGLAGLFVPKNRPGGPAPIDLSADVLIEVGRRLAGNTTRAPRDIAGAWKSIFGQLLHQVDEATLLRIISAIPAMASPYAVNIIHRLPDLDSAEIARGLAEIDAQPLSAEVRRAVEFYRRRGNLPAAGWPELDRDLAEFGNA